MLKNSTQPAGGGNVMYPGKVPGKVKYTFAFGALGKDMIYGMIATFSMIYFTDIIKVAPAFIGIMFFAAKIWDAFNDLFMGMLVDNTRSRFGKFVPWLVAGTLINAFVFIILFTDFHLSAVMEKLLDAVILFQQRFHRAEILPVLIVDGPGVRVVAIETAHGTALEKDHKANARAVYCAEAFCGMNVSFHVVLLSRTPCRRKRSDTTMGAQKLHAHCQHYAMFILRFQYTSAYRAAWKVLVITSSCCSLVSLMKLTA